MIESLEPADISAIWKQLHKRDIVDEIPASSEYANFSEELIENSLGSIEVENWLASQDRESVAARLNISRPDSLRAIVNLIATQDVEDEGAVELVDAKLMHGERILSLCRTILRSGRLEIPSLWTDGVSSTRTCIIFPGVPWRTPIYAYRFAAEEVFYLLVSGFNACEAFGLFFPAQQMGLAFSQRADASEVLRMLTVRLRLFLLQHADRISAYMRGKDSERHPALLVHSSHFAHNLWNEISAIESLVTTILPADCRLHALHQPNGPLAEIFPELQSVTVVHYHGVSELSEFYLRVIQSNAFCIPLGRVFIPRSVIQRVLTVARRLHHDDVEFSEKILASHDLVVWVTIRTDVRICQNQVELLTDAIRTLATGCGALAIVIDGFTPGYGLPVDQRLLNEEHRLARSIMDAVSIPCSFISLVGANLLQSYVWGGIADFYIANHGSIQHKIAWLHDIPGIVHAPPLDELDQRNFIALTAREGCIIPDYIYGRALSGGGSKPKDARTDLKDYILPLQDLKTAIEKVVQLLVRRERATPLPTKAEYAIDASFYGREAVLQLSREGSAAWSEGRWDDALDHFAAAVKALPKYRQSHVRLLTFLLMSFRSWFQDDASLRAGFLGLLFAAEFDPKNPWIRDQLIEAILDTTDDEKAIGMLRALILISPQQSQGFEESLQRLAERPKQRDRLEALIARTGIHS